ncbi:hypothetical protein D3C87_1804180 [compost metagenome]
MQRFGDGFGFGLTAASDEIDAVAAFHVHRNQSATHFFRDAELIPAVVHFFPKFRVFQILLAAWRVSFFATPEARAGKEDGIVDVETNGHWRAAHQAVFDLCHGDPVNGGLFSQNGGGGSGV